MQRWAVWLCACVATIGWGGAGGLRGAEGEAPTVVANVQVVSDKVEDVSSLEAWRKAAIKPGMSDKEKVLAAWEAVLKFRHHDVTPVESLGMNWNGCTDAVKLFNVYGYCTGAGAQVAFIQLLRSMGIPTRAWSVFRWGVVEAQYDGAWHYLDPGMLCYYLNAKGEIASVDEIVAGLKEWYEKNPGYKDDDKKIREFMKDPGVAKGPAILSNCPTFDARNAYPLNYFGWYTTMMVFNGGNKTPFLYEEPHTQGHRINLTLHRGEKITRYWNAEHLPADWFKENPPECRKTKTGEGPLYYTPKYGDLGNGRVGSGEVVYTVDLLRGLAGAVLSADNLAGWPGPQKEMVSGIGIKDPGKAAVLVFERANGYLYAGGKVECDTLIGAGGSIAVAVSWDNGASWKDAGAFKAGDGQAVDVSALIAHKYQYRLKLTLTGAGTGLKDLKITEQFQCSQRALPALGVGANAIAVSAGAQEGTVTVEGTNPKFKDKQATWEDFHVAFEGADPKKVAEDGVVVAQQGKGTTVTVPIETPGDLVRVRFGCQYRAADKAEGWDYQVSFDEGKTWKAAGRAAGPVRCSTEYVSFAEVPKGVRKVLVRYAGDSKGNLVLFGFRVDADYVRPHAGALPVVVTYAWEEGGVAKSQSFTAKTAAEKFTITCGAKPAMQSITLEVAP
ncbi:MAG TPA: hypothetical protein VL860_12800 [Planctomycetota bacterium]|nr:hypothetical protein [Planctomycetota bacterium]